jgi:phenylacetate-CoA ligase
MKLDLTHFKLNNRAFSEAPMSFLNPEPQQFFSTVIDVVAVETGNPAATEAWRKSQIRNLLRHAHGQSPFWRKRIGAKAPNAIRLTDLPIMTRDDLRSQVASEGSLVRPGAGLDAWKHSTSGSSGKPVEFYISSFNARYNNVRSAAQYFIEQRDLTLNRTRLTPLNANDPQTRRLVQGLATQSHDGWLGPLSAVFRNGRNKEISYWSPKKEAVLRELSREPIGYLVGQPRFIEAIFGEHIGFLRDNGLAMFIPTSEPIDDVLRERFDAAGVPVRGNYSCEETGMIGAECPEHKNHYHVATSNVIVEANKADSFVREGAVISQILVTHLHSYATPLIRYDVGDYGVLSDGCPCGHQGPTVSHIHGRSKNLLKHADGRLSLFHIRARAFLDIVEMDEYRIRQTALDRVVVEIARSADLTEAERKGVLDLVRLHADDERIEIEIRRVDAIAWGDSRKKLGYRSEVV